MNFNYCPGCGEDLSEIGDTSEDNKEQEEDDPYEEVRYIDDSTMDDIDVHDLRHSDVDISKNRV